MSAPTTTITYMRGGREVRLVQRVSKTGIPCCVQCMRPIPASYRRWYALVKRAPFFCTDTCARKYANDVAAECWVPPPAPAADEPLPCPKCGTLSPPAARVPGFSCPKCGALFRRAPEVES